MKTLVATGAILCGALLAAPDPGQAQQGYQGAAAVLRQVKEAAATSGEAQLRGAAGDLRRQLRAFPQKAATMPPAEAAAEWLKLVESYLAIRGTPVVVGNGAAPPLQFREVIAALPPPSA